MTQICLGDSYANCTSLPQTNALTLIAQKQEQVRIFFTLNNVKTRKICIRECANSNYTSCDTNWGLENGESCYRANTGSYIDFTLPNTIGYYQLMTAGYTPDNNYACSTQLYYTQGSTQDPAIISCSLGTNCDCSNKPINIEIRE